MTPQRLALMIQASQGFSDNLNKGWDRKQQMEILNKELQSRQSLQDDQQTHALDYQSKQFLGDRENWKYQYDTQESQRAFENLLGFSNWKTNDKNVNNNFTLGKKAQKLNENKNNFYQSTEFPWTQTMGRADIAYKNALTNNVGNDNFTALATLRLNGLLNGYKMDENNNWITKTPASNITLGANDFTPLANFDPNADINSEQYNSLLNEINSLLEGIPQEGQLNQSDYIKAQTLFNIVEPFIGDGTNGYLAQAGKKAYSPSLFDIAGDVGMDGYPTGIGGSLYGLGKGAYNYFSDPDNADYKKSQEQAARANVLMSMLRSKLGFAPTSTFGKGEKSTPPLDK